MCKRMMVLLMSLYFTVLQYMYIVLAITLYNVQQAYMNIYIQLLPSTDFPSIVEVAAWSSMEQQRSIRNEEVATSSATVLVTV